VLEAHNRRANRDAALALDGNPIRTHPPPLAAPYPDRPAKQELFSVKVSGPASGCEMIAKARCCAISSVRARINRFQLALEPVYHAKPIAARARPGM
jgi:hypothetical protein